MKKLLLLLGVTGMLFSFSSCSKDGENPIEEIFQLATVKIIENSDSIKISFPAAIAKDDVAGRTLIVANTATSTTSMIISLDDKSVRAHPVDITDKLLGFSLDKLPENTVVVYTDEKKYLMVGGTINVTSSSGYIMQGNFDGTVIDATDLQNITDIDVILGLITNKTYISGTFQTAAL